MALLDRLRVFAADLEKLLQPGEVALALQTVSYMRGVEERGEPLGSVSVDITGLDVPAWNRAAERLVGGTTLTGWPGCQADAVVAALGPDGGSDLVLTDRRLVIADGIGTDTARVVAEFPRAAIASLAHRRRLLQQGLVDLYLADGSAAVLVLGVFSAGGAKRLVSAWSSSAQ